MGAIRRQQQLGLAVGTTFARVPTDLLVDRRGLSGHCLSHGGLKNMVVRVCAIRRRPRLSCDGMVVAGRQ